MDEQEAQQAVERAENLAVDLDARENTTDSAVQTMKQIARALPLFDLVGRRYAAKAINEARAQRHELRQQWAAALDALELAKANLLEASKAALSNQSTQSTSHLLEAERQSKTLDVEKCVVAKRDASIFRPK